MTIRSGYFTDFTKNLLLSLSVKEFRKSVSIWFGKVRGKNIEAAVFRTQCMSPCVAVTLYTIA